MDLVFGNWKRQRDLTCTNGIDMMLQPHHLFNHWCQTTQTQVAVSPKKRSLCINHITQTRQDVDRVIFHLLSNSFVQPTPASFCQASSWSRCCFDGSNHVVQAWGQQNYSLWQNCHIPIMLCLFTPSQEQLDCKL